jgi:hypothetical protein
MYQQIQGLNTEEKGLEISKIWFFQTNLSNNFVRYEHAKSIQQNVRPISENIQKLKQEKFINTDFQVLLYKFKDIQDLEFLFSNSKTFKSRTFKFCTNPEITNLYS